jgi:hypothetical protein
VIRIGWLFVAGDGPFRKGPIMTTEFTSIQTTERPSRDWMALAVGGTAGLLALCLLLASIGMFAMVRAASSHRAATLELNTTLRQLHLKNELAISKMENREPRLQPSESPLEQ